MPHSFDDICGLFEDSTGIPADLLEKLRSASGPRGNDRLPISEEPVPLLSIEEGEYSLEGCVIPFRRPVNRRPNAYQKPRAREDGPPGRSPEGYRQGGREQVKDITALLQEGGFQGPAGAPGGQGARAAHGARGQPPYRPPYQPRPQGRREPPAPSPPAQEAAQFAWMQDAGDDADASAFTGQAMSEKDRQMLARLQPTASMTPAAPGAAGVAAPYAGFPGPYQYQYPASAPAAARAKEPLLVDADTLVEELMGATGMGGAGSTGGATPGAPAGASAGSPSGGAAGGTGRPQAPSQPQQAASSASSAQPRPETRGETPAKPSKPAESAGAKAGPEAKKRGASPRLSPRLSPKHSPKAPAKAPQSPSSPAARARNPASILWEYIGSDGRVYGPFNQAQMLRWYTDGKFPTDLRIRRAGVDAQFTPLSEKWAAHTQRNQVPFSVALGSSQ